MAVTKPTIEQIDNPYKCRAYKSAAQTISDTTVTKMQFNTETFDPNGDFDNATGYDYTAPVTGYYQVNGSVLFNVASAAVLAFASVFVNGSEYSRGTEIYTGKYQGISVSCLVYATAGQTIDLRVYQDSGASRDTFGGSSLAYIDIHLLST